MNTFNILFLFFFLSLLSTTTCAAHILKSTDCEITAWRSARYSSDSGLDTLTLRTDLSSPFQLPVYTCTSRTYSYIIVNEYIIYNIYIYISCAATGNDNDCRVSFEKSLSRFLNISNVIFECIIILTSSRDRNDDFFSDWVFTVVKSIDCEWV